MCSRYDDPSTYDEPLEDSVDWATLRHIRDERLAAASPSERAFGIPERMDIVRREADRISFTYARRGWRFEPGDSGR
jgi:hypothetical protein